MSSLVRQNYHQECEAAVNKQINLELYASYVHMSLAFYFNRDDVSFPGAHKFFEKQSDEEREHAQKLMKFQNERGGRIVLQDIQKPAKDAWGSPLEALQAAMELEKQVNQAAIDLHALASTHNDPHMTDYIEEAFLGPKVECLKKLGDLITQAKRCGNGLGEYVFDQESMAESH